MHTYVHTMLHIGHFPNNISSDGGGFDKVHTSYGMYQTDNVCNYNYLCLW